jgi:hypothetical protein
MKTAMQDMLEWVRATFPMDLNTPRMIEHKIESLLEKEKEQIMNAYCDGAKGGANGTKGQHEFGWVSRHTRNKYYNEKYNQNK